MRTTHTVHIFMPNNSPSGEDNQYAKISPTLVPSHWKHDSHHLQVTDFYRFLFLYEARGCNTISQQVLMSHS